MSHPSNTTRGSSMPGRAPGPLPELVNAKPAQTRGARGVAYTRPGVPHVGRRPSRQFTLSTSPGESRMSPGMAPLQGDLDRGGFSGLVIVGQRQFKQRQNLTWPGPRQPIPPKQDYKAVRVKTITEEQEITYPKADPTTPRERILADRERRKAVCIVEAYELSELEEFVLNVIMPTLTKPGYATMPLLMHVREMTQAQMRQVEGFKMEREGIGKMEWEEPVDLLCADLDFIEIEKGKATIDVSELESLNRPCSITLMGMFPREGATPEEIAYFPAELKSGIEDMGADFISYDQESGVLVFRCDRFDTPCDVNIVIENPRTPPGSDIGLLESPEILSTPAMAWRIMGWSLRDRNLVKMAMAGALGEGENDDNIDPLGNYAGVENRNQCM
eukprot:TRINITY_DN3926_c0_g1_i1.p1 TRINITY_DN3926_c0_g1~~TRINITY_DN3926_c0_g1_i1.p1  ORF type:complete len:388 (-),score=37.35 TRINITY_DN3926_c0_g1_i1:122-1285(-)